MTYDEIVLKVRQAYENADAREIFEHIAIQVNITGEGSGAFYIEVANRQICVEPYDYYDKDLLFTADAETILGIAEDITTVPIAHASGALKIEGDFAKLMLLKKIRSKKG